MFNRNILVAASFVPVLLQLALGGNSKTIIFHDADNIDYADKIRSLFPDSTKSTSLQGIVDNGERLFETVICISRKVNLKSNMIVEFMEKGGNLVWALEGNHDPDLLSQFGLYKIGEINGRHSQKGIMNRKHFLSAVLSDGDVSSAFDQNEAAFAMYPTGHPKFNDLIQPLLRASDDFKAKDDQGKVVYGEDIIFMATMDTRADGRLLVSSSVRTLCKSNKQLDVLSRWIKGDLGRLLLTSFDIYQGEQENPEWLIVKSEKARVVACLQLDGKPYLPTDFQVELVMQHPRERVTLTPNSSDSCLHGHLTVPDVYGRYTIRVNYCRPGLSLVSAKRLVNVRPQWLDQVPRFIIAALPYYIGWQVQLAMTVIFLLPLLWRNVATSTQDVDKVKVN